MTLWDLNPNQHAKVSKLGLDKAISQRLSDMGFSQLTDVTCLFVTAFGGPRVYQVGESLLSLSREMAQNIEVS